MSMRRYAYALSAIALMGTVPASAKCDADAADGVWILNGEVPLTSGGDTYPTGVTCEATIEDGSMPKTTCYETGSVGKTRPTMEMEFKVVRDCTLRGKMTVIFPNPLGGRTEPKVTGWVSSLKELLVLSLEQRGFSTVVVGYRSPAK